MPSTMPAPMSTKAVSPVTIAMNQPPEGNSPVAVVIAMTRGQQSGAADEDLPPVVGHGAGLGEGADPVRGEQPQPSGNHGDGAAAQEDDGMPDDHPDDHGAQCERSEQHGDEAGGSAVHVGLQMSSGKREDEIGGAASEHPPGRFVAELVGDEPDEVGAVLLAKPPGVEMDEQPVDPQRQRCGGHAGAPPGR